MAEEITKDTEPTEVVEKTVPYERFNKVIEERNGYKTSLTEKDGIITALNEKLKAFEGYIPPTELEKAKGETQKAYEEKITAMTIQSKLETKLISEGLDVDFTEFVMSKADTSGMQLKDGKVIGLDDVVAGLKEKHPKMFAAKVKGIGTAAGAGATTPAATDEETALKEKIFKAAGLKI